MMDILAQTVYQNNTHKLHQRGIASAAQRMGWREQNGGWVYPVFDAVGYPIGQRWKAFSSQAIPKYKWLKSLPGNTSKGFYHVGAGLLKAIHEAGGVLHFVNGEPAVLTLIEAGISNTVSTFGEGQLPSDLGDHLAGWGVSKVIYYVDKDAAGEKAAGKLAGMLAASQIALEARAMLDTMPAKSDVNDLWQLVGFNPDALRLALQTLPIFSPIVQRETRSLEVIKSAASLSDSHYEEWIADVVRPEIERRITQHTRKHFACLNPAHDDKHPSARITERGVYVCTCGYHSLKEVAGWLGLDFKKWRSEKYPLATAQRRARQPVNTPTDFKPTPVTLPAFNADVQVNLPFITELPFETYSSEATIALKSPTGSGKTELMAALVKADPDATCLAITHRVTLVNALARRLGFMHYRDLDGKDGHLLRSADQIATTIDSLPKQAGRKFDYVFIDEWAQAINHLASGGTLKANTVPTYEILKQIIQNAKCVLVADAGLTNESLKWLRAIRGRVFVIENTHRPARPQTAIIFNRLAAIQTAVEQVEASAGPVLIPCATQRDARHIDKLLRSRFPERKGRIICARNSDTAETKQFVGSINDNLPECAWLTFTSSIGTGVDIQTPVAAVVGIFGQPLTPADAMQMMGRARHAGKRFAHVPASAGGGSSNPAELLADELAAAAESARFQVAEPDGATKGLAKLEAIIRGQRNHQMANYADHFVAYMAADGSSAEILEIEGSAEIRALMQSIADAEAETMRALTLDTLNIPTIDDEQMDSIRRQGSEITDDLLAGNLRHKIESTVGLAINPEIFDRFKTADQRRRLMRFASLIDEESALVEFDQLQAGERVPLHRRKHLASARAFFMGILKQAFGVDTIEQLKVVFADEILGSELSEKLAFISEQILQMRALLGYREGHNAQAGNTVGLFRFVCRQFGIIVNGHRKTRDGLKVWYYSLDTADFDAMLKYAKSRLAARQMQAQAAAKTLSGNMAYEGFAVKCPAPIRPPSNATWKVPAVGSGVSRCNPFSTTVGQGVA